MLVLFLVCVAGALGDNLFDVELYRAALEPALCKRQLAAMTADFYDASFHAPAGLLVGNLASLGNYHQCLAINQDFPGASIQGKHCLIRAPLTPPTIRIPSLTGVSASENVTWSEVTLPADVVQKYAGESLSLAVCVPKSCAVEAVLAPYTEHPVVAFNYTEEYCRLPDDKPFVAADYVGTIVFSLLVVLTVMSTAFELHHIFILKRDPDQASALLSICSLYSNTRRLLTFDKPRSLDCLDGIRSISVLVIIIYHNFSQYFYTGYVANSHEVHEWLRKKQAVWMLSGDIAVDSFFTLSGLLLVYTSINKIKQTSFLRGLHWFYLSRFLRLFPLLAAAVLLQASLLHRVADGPGWHTIARRVGRCRRNWWSALLHVQNFVRLLFSKDQINSCGPHLWYLSVDMQLHIISPLVLYWVLGRRRAWTALMAGIIASLVATIAFSATINYDFAISLLGQREANDNITDYLIYNYFNTLVRSPPFFVGMLFGYILHVYREQKIKLFQWVEAACHALALATFIYTVYIVHPCMQEGWDNRFADSINNSLRRPAWSLALCWMIFACVHGYGGPVNWFLSLRLWKFTSRISYSMYLFHYLIQEVNAAAATIPIYFSMATMFTLFASDLVYTVVVSTAMCVVVEEPALTLQRMLLPDVSKKVKKIEEENIPVPNIQETEIG